MDKKKKLSKKLAWIDPSICIGCQQCVETCPQSAIQNWEENIFVKPEMCNGCGKCANQCPAEAIEILERE